MKKSLTVLLYIDSAISCIKGYVNISLTFVFMGVLTYFQANDFEFIQQQQLLFINMNTLSLMLCIILETLRFATHFSEKEVCNIFIKLFLNMVTILSMYGLFSMYARTNSKPYTTIDLEIFIYVMTGFILLSRVLQSAIRRISFANPS